MEAKKCDRCGMFYTPYNQNSWENANNIYLCQEKMKEKENCTEKKYDLCPDCMRSLQEWLKRDGEV